MEGQCGQTSQTCNSEVSYLVMVHISCCRGFLSIGSRVSFEQYMVFMLFSAKKSLQARLGLDLKAAAKAGQARPIQSRAGLAA